MNAHSFLALIRVLKIAVSGPIKKIECHSSSKEVSNKKFNNFKYFNYIRRFYHG